MEMIVDKKKIQAIFLFQFKMGHKRVETTHNINSTFDLGTNEHTVQQRFKFCKGDESLDAEGHSGQSEIYSDYWEPSLKMILL